MLSPDYKCAGRWQEIHGEHKLPRNTGAARQCQYFGPHTPKLQALEVIGLRGSKGSLGLGSLLALLPLHLRVPLAGHILLVVYVVGLLSALKQLACSRYLVNRILPHLFLGPNLSRRKLLSILGVGRMV